MWDVISSTWLVKNDLIRQLGANLFDTEFKCYALWAVDYKFGSFFVSETVVICTDMEITKLKVNA